MISLLTRHSCQSGGMTLARIRPWRSSRSTAGCAMGSLASDAELASFQRLSTWSMRRSRCSPLITSTGQHQNSTYHCLLKTLFDGNKKIKGIKRHVLTCSLGIILSIVVTAANVHDTKAAGELLTRAEENGWNLKRVKADGIYIGDTIDQVARKHHVSFQIATHDSKVKPQGFTPLPLRWRIEQTFGTLSTRYRRLTRNWEESPGNAEDAVKIANCRQLIRSYVRDILGAS
jgi:transposase